MKGSEVEKLGVPILARKVAMKLCGRASKLGYSKDDMRSAIADVVNDPEANLDEEAFGGLAAYIIEHRSQLPLQEPVSFRVWGSDIDDNALEQMDAACHLPVAVRGAVMPDAHLGYGLPIGGVLATEGAIIPWAVGVDIACRMKLTVFEMKDHHVKGKRDKLAKIIEDNTAFGIGSAFRREDRLDHPVLEKDWNISKVTKSQRTKAWKQLGSSGSGNHFVEFGFVEVEDGELDMDDGVYLALLSHSGSRGPGATVATHYADLAQEIHPQLPKNLRKLAWLDMDSHEGQEYWRAMNLMGDYASACHAVIHDKVTEALGAEIVTSVENHHNFCWKEEHDGKELYVHRKGATPASEGELGVIPGTMVHPAYIVRGKGDADSLRSASHGAGRVMSRSQAKRELTQKDIESSLNHAGVTLLSSGLDEAPHVYKDIDEVMAEQEDLVEVVGKFTPKIVKMAPPGEPPED